MLSAQTDTESQAHLPQAGTFNKIATRREMQHSPARRHRSSLPTLSRRELGLRACLGFNLKEGSPIHR
jgi:hypothetical protein